MSHTIKISDEVYGDLQKLQRPRESYSAVIQRLLRMVQPLLEVVQSLGPSHYLRSDTPPGAKRGD
jgi:predicted CopG family antitoxin